MTAAAQTAALSLPGIHHVTAFAGDPQWNYDFYAETLGLRLLKVTVNFDDPGTYHTYYGDYAGSPGTAITFFPSPRALPGRLGTGQVAVTQFAVPKGSLNYWYDRLCLIEGGVSEPFERMGDLVMAFSDPDGMKLEIVEPSRPETRPDWTGGPVEPQHALRGFYGVTLASASPEETGRQLTEVMGFRLMGETEEVRRYQAAGGEGSVADVLLAPPGIGRFGAGTVHHVAWRTATDEDQLGWRDRLMAAGRQVTGVRDRNYFHSIYHAEPGGVIFEIATDGPGFDADEPLEALGRDLKLPDWLETRRDSVRARLPHFRTLEGVEFP